MNFNDLKWSKSLRYGKGWTVAGKGFSGFPGAGSGWIRGGIMRLNLIIFFLTGMLMQVSAISTAQITLSERKTPLLAVIKSLKKQSGYHFFYNDQNLKEARPVTVSLKNVSLEAALKACMEGQELTFKIEEKMVVIKPKPKSLLDKVIGKFLLLDVKGVVRDEKGEALAGATVRVKGTDKVVMTGSKGEFVLVGVEENAVLVISYLGFESRELKAQKDMGDIAMVLSSGKLEEVSVVVNTGYQSIPKERATGSFSTVNNELFNQQISTDILSRIPNVANSVMMDQSGYNGQIMVRGLSTISGPKDPLIILDNFPYEGDLKNINPNIVDNITILKDASASSIWGARAANGVIVITTKKGLFNSPINIQFNSSLTIGSTPDLGYISQMSSSDFIDVEQELYNKGFYKSKLSSRNKPVISPVVDYLDKVSKGLLSVAEANKAIDDLREIDVRDQFNQYMYKRSTKQQYYLSAQGGSDKFSWLSAVGYDNNKESLGELYNRLNIRFQNTFKPIKNFSIATNLYYTQTGTASGRLGYRSIANLFPYTQMADENGNPLPVAKNWNQSYIETAGEGKLLDWNYYPLTDWKHQTTKSTASSILASVGLKYELADGLTSSMDYQYERESGLSTSLADEESYMARDYINRFTQIVNNTAVYMVPKGGILDKSNNILNTQNLRGQLAFERTFSKHNINAIAGAEMRSTGNDGNQTKYYGYNPHNLTSGNVDYTKSYPNFITGAATTILNGNSLVQTDRRYISQFANAAYTYDQKYILSASLRRDASNLFGLKTNDQWNPFWSAGLAWKISNERFYHFDLVPYLNLRSTYGYSGNINPAMVAVNTIRYLPRSSVYTGTTMAQFNNYFNPELKWETSKMFNIALDFQAKNNRVSGSLEFYHKKGINLFGMSQIDYTTGVDPYMLRNVARMKGRGLDIELKSRNIDKIFQWNTLLNFSLFKDQIEEYNVNRNLAVSYISTNVPPVSGVAGHPVYAMYAHKWAGLDPETGEARGYLNGEISKDYNNIIGEGTALEDLQYFGSAIPTKFGSLINSFAYKQVSLQIGISYKFGYWFRRSSINYTELFNNWRGHADYSLRWQKTGDELNTNIPSSDYKTNSSRDQFFEGSSVLVERGDHIRLQYINLAYNFNNIRNIKSFQLFLNAHNLGMLWSATKSGIDPDFNINLNGFVSPANYSVGIRAQF